MSDYMKEVERLLAEHEQAAGLCRYADCQTTRASLLAHIQRGAAPDGVGAFRHKETGQVRYTLIGGEHDEDEWEDVLIVPMLAAAPAPDHFRGVTKMVPAPAGVPMPKPVAYGFGNTAITGHTNRLMMVRIDVPLDDQYAGAFWLPLVLADEAHTYGVACRAAGEAAGYARGREEAGRDAERYRWLCDKATEQQWVELGGYTVTNDIDDYIDAAMRREVK